MSAAGQGTEPWGHARRTEGCHALVLVQAAETAMLRYNGIIWPRPTITSPPRWQPSASTSSRPVAPSAPPPRPAPTRSGPIARRRLQIDRCQHELPRPDRASKPALSAERLKELLEPDALPDDDGGFVPNGRNAPDRVAPADQHSRSLGTAALAVTYRGRLDTASRIDKARRCCSPDFMRPPLDLSRPG
jgi:hypothetical protein